MMWRKIPGYTGYEVSENGAVRRYNDQEELSGSISGVPAIPPDKRQDRSDGPNKRSRGCYDGVLRPYTC